MNKPDSETARSRAREGDVVLVKCDGRAYRAKIERAEPFQFKIMVRPLDGQGVTTRVRAIWRKSIREIVTNAE